MVKRCRSPKFEIFVAVEASAPTESNDEYPFVEAELTGDELQQAETNMDLTLLTNLGT
jgi:hypothetical protein